MEIKTIRNEQDYEATLQEIDRLWDAEPDTPEEDRLQVFVTLVEAYEREHYEIPQPDPIAAIEYFMESRGWTEKEMAPVMGSRQRVTEVLARTRPLTLTMIRNLEHVTGIPATILIKPYPTPTKQPARTKAYSLPQAS